LVRTLDGLIEDLRTLTLVETGGLTLRREMVDLAELINAIDLRLADLAEDPSTALHAAAAIYRPEAGGPSLRQTS
jgi:signal transduction histidine kinase